MSDFQYVCTRVDLEAKLEACLEKTLGEVDTARVFDAARKNPKITGIAGDVVEQSIIGYPPNSGQEPDLVVDGVEVELKTTGLRKSKKFKGLEAKEPMSITAVSLDKIVEEEFAGSSFWHKLEHLLIVYYLYASDTTVKAIDYANFPLKGYQFHEFDEDERAMLESDWTCVRDFIRRIHDEYQDEASRKKLYPNLSSALRKDLMLIDTAPKYPHPPRFRLKRSTVTTMARKAFGDRMTQLPKAYTNYGQIDAKLRKVSSRMAGRRAGDIAHELGIAPTANGDLSKNIAESIIVRAFGGKGLKMNRIELFSKIGLHAKTFTCTKSGGRTEDMKLFTIDFDEFSSPNITFEASLFFEYFTNNQFLFPVFEEPSEDAPLSDNVFLGFKRMVFDDDFIETHVRCVWERIRDLIVNGELVDVVCRDKKGNPIRNKKTGTVKSAPNLPKSSQGPVFVRGTGKDSTDKTLCINGVRMYRQQLWVKGAYMAELLRDEPFV